MFANKLAKRGRMNIVLFASKYLRRYGLMVSIGEILNQVYISEFFEVDTIIGVFDLNFILDLLYYLTWHYYMILKEK